jgi:hypothetical protein
VNKQAAILRRGAETISRNIQEREPDPQKGERDWEAFAAVSIEDWTFVMINDLACGIQDVPVAKSRGLYHRLSDRFLASWVYAASSSIDPYVASIEEKFDALSNRWHDETDFLSSPSRITGNDTYLEVISMGKRVIPLILEDLKERGGDWYRALRILSEEDPVPVEARGDVEQMKRSWLQWGHERGYMA